MAERSCGFIFCLVTIQISSNLQRTLGNENRVCNQEDSISLLKVSFLIFGMVADSLHPTHLPLSGPLLVSSRSFYYQKNWVVALAGWLSWLEHCPILQKAACMILSQGTCLGLWVGSLVGEHMGSNQSMFLTSVSLSLSSLLPFLPPFLHHSLKTISISSGEDLKKIE